MTGLLRQIIHEIVIELRGAVWPARLYWLIWLKNVDAAGGGAPPHFFYLNSAAVFIIYRFLNVPSRIGGRDA